MNINSERLWANIHRLSEIGRNETGGVTRLSFTDTERNAKELVASFMKEAGLDVRQDAIGNLIGLRKGLNPDLPVVLTGSHIDSVINGGNFDGPAGVLTAIEAIHTMNEKGLETQASIEVIVFTDEEGARFSTGMFGSRAVAGQLQEEELYSAKDQAGISIAEAMEKAGFDPRLAGKARRDPQKIKAYVELHIEQGKVLEHSNSPAGIVTGIVGVDWYRLTLKGEAGHAGTTPMVLRKDPLAAAANIMAFAEDLARKEAASVITVGQLNVKPGGINIIPGEVELSFDIRDVDKENLQRIYGSLEEYIDTICKEREIEFTLEELHRLEPTPCSGKVIGLIKESFEEAGVTPVQLISGAGHDAMVMASITEIGMIFVRSKEGISHNPKEWTEKDDLAAGAEILYNTLLKLAE